MFDIEIDAMVEATAMQNAHCENCSLDYVYPVHRLGYAAEQFMLGFDIKGAIFWSKRRAKRNLERNLRSALELVPCPVCGWYQSGMCRQIRRDKQDYTLCAVILCGMAIAFSGLIFLNQQNEKLTAVAVCAVIICIGFRFHRIWFRNYSPNCNHPGKGGYDTNKAAASCGIPLEYFNGVHQLDAANASPRTTLEQVSRWQRAVEFYRTRRG